ncbi:MAG: cupin domain-containing protein, partial [Gammaproteobacteria bacterium]|nr:cupin domain-containing protein [Gammaproteobacteria bacterium]
MWWIDSTVDVRLTAAETDGQLGMWLWVAQRGAASPLHVHHREDEQFLLIDGQARFRVGEQWLEAGPGDSIFLPRGRPHAYVIAAQDQSSLPVRNRCERFAGLGHRPRTDTWISSM